MKKHDAIVIGAGPAGTATALFLESSGFDVLLLDQAKFPRDKVCGEFISPAADPLLAELGVLGDIERLAPPRLRGVAVSAYGDPEVCIDYPPWHGQAHPTSLSLRRIVLDDLLVQRVRRSGVTLREGWRVRQLIHDGGAVAGVSGEDDSGTGFTLRARVVVDAGGRNAISLRLLNLKLVNGGGTGRIAMAAHWRDVGLPGDYCYMHVSPPGYTGTARVDGDLTNVVLVVETGQARGRNAGDFYRRTVTSCPRRALLFAGARLVEEPRIVESLAFSVRPVPCDGLLLAGDAMGFIDPFTGEGIYLALRGARLAAGAIVAALRAQGSFTRRHQRQYEALRRSEFDGKFRLSRMLQWTLYRPRLAKRVVATLRNRPDLAATLVGVIGDYRPAGEAVCMGYLMKFLWGLARAGN